MTDFFLAFFDFKLGDSVKEGRNSKFGRRYVLVSGESQNSRKNEGHSFKDGIKLAS